MYSLHCFWRDAGNIQSRFTEVAKVTSVFHDMGEEDWIYKGIYNGGVNLQVFSMVKGCRLIYKGIYKGRVNLQVFFMAWGKGKGWIYNGINLQVFLRACERMRTNLQRNLQRWGKFTSVFFFHGVSEGTQVNLQSRLQKWLNLQVFFMIWMKEWGMNLQRHLQWWA